MLIENPETARSVLHRLKATGFQLHLDDFGTSYSSLSYLHQYPFDLVKIDRSFVEGLGANAGDSAIVAAVVPHIPRVTVT